MAPANNPVARTVIAGSDRTALPNSKVVSPVAPDERIEITVRVKRKTPIDLDKVITTQAPRQYVSREKYAESHGADPAAIQKVEDFARANNLAVVGSDADRRSVFLSGTAAELSKAFGTKLEHYAHASGTYRGRTGPLSVPASVADVIEGVFGLDDRPAARPHFQRCQPRPQVGLQLHATMRSFTPVELADIYDFPTDAGSGQCIGLIELGGGYRPADLETYFSRLQLPAPKVTAVRVDGALNAPSTPDGADGEVMLDIEVAAAIAPEAGIVVYFAPNTTRGFLDAITTAVHDRAHKPTVISISWGSAETNWTVQAKNSYNEAFQAAAALGVSICAAAGDNGSGDGVGDGKPHVDFPASSPFVLACGGTRLVMDGGKGPTETVWNDGPASATGGGFSTFFDVPAYQKASPDHQGLKAGAHARGVPDVAGNADPATGYQIRVDGVDTVIGGTSAVAPLWAAYIAKVNQGRAGSKKNALGFMNPSVYAHAAAKGGAAFNDVTVGSNGHWHAGPGWDPCSGCGSPNGKALTGVLLAQP